MCPKSTFDFPSTPKLSTYDEMKTTSCQLLRGKIIEITLKFSVFQISYKLSSNSFGHIFKINPECKYFTSVHDLTLSYYHF